MRQEPFHIPQPPSSDLLLPEPAVPSPAAPRSSPTLTLVVLSLGGGRRARGGTDGPPARDRTGRVRGRRATPRVPADTVPRVPRPRCYVASPLGFSETTRPWYRDVMLPALGALVECVDPWALTSEGEVLGAQAAGRDREIALEIGRRNIEAIRSSALLVAVLDGQEPDSGTVAELGYAAGLGLRCWGVRSDLRQAGEAGVPVNLQVVSFVEASGGAIETSLEGLLTRLRADLVGRRPGPAGLSRRAAARGRPRPPRGTDA